MMEVGGHASDNGSFPRPSMDNDTRTPPVFTGHTVAN